MKNKLIFTLMFLTVLSCSSDDKNTPSVDVSLLYGQWFHINLCPNQNNLVLNNNGTYVHTYSGNFCDNNDNDTYQFTGTYIILGNNITFNQISEEIIENGDAINTPVSVFSTLIHQKIIVLEENELIIERKFKIDQYFYNNWHFTK